MQNSRGLVKRFFASRMFLVVGLAVFIGLSLVYIRAYYQNLEVKGEIDRLQAEASRLESKKIQSLEALQYVKSDAYVEEKARTELNLAKDGEKVTVISGSQPIRNGQTDKTMVTSQSLSIPRQWWNYFFNHN